MLSGAYALSGHLPPAPSSPLPSSCLFLLPAHHSSEPLTSSNHPNQYQSGDPPLGLRNIEVPPPGKVPLCQFLLLLLSMCVGYMRTAAAMGCMDVAKASDVFLCLPPWRYYIHVTSVYVTSISLFNLSGHPGLHSEDPKALLKSCPHCCLKLCVSCVTLGRI